jgi:MFS family permease
MDKWFGALQSYFADMFRHTVGKLTGFLSIALGVAPVIFPDFFGGDRGLLHVRSVWWIASAIAFFLASLAAWREQHEELLKCQKQIEDRKPKFQLILEAIYRDFNFEKNHTNYMMSGILRNSGSPSVASGWRAVYKRPKEPDEPMSQKYLARPFFIRAEDGEVSVTNASLLQTRTYTTSLGFGDARSGRIYFTLPGNRLNENRGIYLTPEPPRCSVFGHGRGLSTDVV